MTPKNTRKTKKSAKDLKILCRLCFNYFTIPLTSDTPQ